MRNVGARRSRLTFKKGDTMWFSTRHFLFRNSPMEGIAQAIFPKVFAAIEI
jgi:hypothetical protein